MATDIYVDWSAAGGQNSGIGTQLDPYGSIHFALTTQAAAQANLATLAGLNVHVEDSAATGVPSNDDVLTLSSYGFTNASTTNRITITAGAGKRPAGLLPQLNIVGTATGLQWTIDSVGAVVDGFLFTHTGTGFVNVTAVSTSTTGTDAIVRNCAFSYAARAFGTNAQYIQHGQRITVENCLFIGGRKGIIGTSASVTRTVRNNTFIDQNVADEVIANGGVSTYHSNAFLNVLGTAINNDADFTGADNAIDAVSAQGKTGIWSIQNLTSAAFNNYAGGDYRPADGGALEDAGHATLSTATDMFGATRTTPDIGFSEAVTALVAPVLSSPTPSGTLGTQTTATIGATTDQNSGTFYAVVGTGSDVVGITAAEIKAGQIAGGAAAFKSGNSAITTTTPSVGVTGLAIGTAYVYAAVQNNGSGDSNIVTGSFTTAPAAPSSRSPPSAGPRIATLLLT
jgi:hypothetical protein